MLNLSVPSTSPNTQLVESGSGPALIVNNDPTFTLWLGSNNSFTSNDSNTVPLAANSSVAVDGNNDVFAVADPATDLINVLVITGGQSLFRPFTQLLVQGSNARILIYAGVAGSGNLIGSWAAQAGTDIYGNSYPAGIDVQQGSLTGVDLLSSSFIAGTILQTLISGSQIQSSSFSGGSISQSIITFNSTAGGLFLYTTTTNVITYNSGAGLYGYTPSTAAVTSVRVQCWGGDAGGGGGNATGGGEAGGGAEYAEEPNYPVTFGQNYNVLLGSGGAGNTTGAAGSDGTATQFDGQGVIANGGSAGSGGVGGLGGTGSAASIHHNGGNGGSNPSNFAASAGGGGRAGSTGAGGNGGNPTSNTSPGAAGAAGSGTGGHAGGVGVTANSNGNNGGGGSGAGATAGTSTITKTYRPTETASYYGSEVGNGRRNTNGGMYQGCASGEINATGDQYSIALYNKAQINSDFSGATITSVEFEITNSHSWYNSGGYLIFGYAGYQSLGPTGNLSGSTRNVDANFISEGATQFYNLPSFKSVIQAGNFGCLILGQSKDTSGGAQDLWNYTINNGGPSFGPVLTIQGKTGGGFSTAGSGADGMAVITETSTSSMVGGISAYANQTDANGNELALGFTGQITAIQPNSNPAVPETWHPVTLDSGWTAVGDGIKYRLSADGTVQVFGAATHAAFTASTALNSSNPLPSVYWPSRTRNIGGPGIPSRAGVECTSAGVLTAIPNGTSCTEADVGGFYPLY